MTTGKHTGEDQDKVRPTLWTSWSLTTCFPCLAYYILLYFVTIQGDSRSTIQTCRPSRMIDTNMCFLGQALYSKHLMVQKPGDICMAIPCPKSAGDVPSIWIRHWASHTFHVKHTPVLVYTYAKNWTAEQTHQDYCEYAAHHHDERCSDLCEQRSASLTPAHSDLQSFSLLLPANTHLTRHRELHTTRHTENTQSTSWHLHSESKNMPLYIDKC